MAGYLDQYGAGEEKRENIIKFSVLGVLFLVFFGSLGYYLFKNHSQEGKVGSSSKLCGRRTTRGISALGMFGSGACPGYPYDKFHGRLGPEGRKPDVLRIEDSENCNSGVILTVDTAAIQTGKNLGGKRRWRLGILPVRDVSK